MHDKYWCKSCKSSCDRVYREVYREELKVKKREYYLANRDTILVKMSANYYADRDNFLAKCRDYYVRNRAAILKRNAEYEARDPERWKQYWREYRLQNSEHIKERQRVWTQVNQDSIRDKKREYIAANRKLVAQRQADWLKRRRAEDPIFLEEQRTRVRNRRYRVHANGGTHTVEDIERLWTEQGGRCKYCRQMLDKSREVDHIIPVSKGGVNDPCNLQLLCRSCNRQKHDRIVVPTYIAGNGRMYWRVVPDNSPEALAMMKAGRPI